MARAAVLSRVARKGRLAKSKDRKKVRKEGAMFTNPAA